MKNLPRAFTAIALIASSLIVASPLTLVAQRSSTQFNLAAGAAFPTGDFGQVSDVGYNLTVGLGMKQPMSAVGFRVEGMYNEWNSSRFSNLKSHAGGITGNVTFDLGSTPGAGAGNHLYVIGGADYLDTGNQWNGGFNVGGGFRFPLTGFSAYVEARYHMISGPDVRFVPVVFGLVF